MSETSPKTPQQIIIRVTDRAIDGGMAGAVQKQENESLAELISRYLIRLGFDSAVTSGIIVQLLTKGKVRVDFSKVAERLELVKRDDCMTAPQAMAVFEDYVTSMRGEDDLNEKSKTIRIVVQNPHK
jgi:hypothetical protein|tara:strand:+ start:275 stop:655 length:381 start_codon:yes stop_codon:yes gene_type:complete